MTRDTFSYAALGRHLRQMREDAGLTQAELAGRLGMSKGNVNHIEHHRDDRRIHVEDLFAWSSICGRPLTLVWGTPTPSRRYEATGFDITTRRYEVTL